MKVTTARATTAARKTKSKHNLLGPAQQHDSSLASATVVTNRSKASTLLEISEHEMRKVESASIDVAQNQPSECKR